MHGADLVFLFLSVPRYRRAAGSFIPSSTIMALWVVLQVSRLMISFRLHTDLTIVRLLASTQFIVFLSACHAAAPQTHKFRTTTTHTAIGKAASWPLRWCSAAGDAPGVAGVVRHSLLLAAPAEQSQHIVLCMLATCSCRDRGPLPTRLCNWLPQGCC